MKKLILLSFLLFNGIALVNAQNMSMNPKVGGHAMHPNKNIVQNAMHSNAHTILVKAVKAAGLVKTLEGDGPFTVLAPTNAAFHKLPSKTLKKLMKPKNKSKLKNILTYHVIPGKLTYDKLAKAIKKGNGSTKFKTVNGEQLTFIMNGAHNIVIKDSSGNTAHIITYDVDQSNGVIQVIDSVLMP
jgi:uncharacterized surface protein with fasciclin (FAS1) repeats